MFRKKTQKTILKDKYNKYIICKILKMIDKKVRLKFEKIHKNNKKNKPCNEAV